MPVTAVFLDVLILLSRKDTGRAKLCSPLPASVFTELPRDGPVSHVQSHLEHQKAWLQLSNF